MGKDIVAVTMPKWGLAMEEGTVAAWHVREGAVVAKDDDLADIETTKITNLFEAPAAGTVRRLVVAEGAVAPVGALLSVIADPVVPEAEIDAFVAGFEAEVAPREAAAEPVETAMIDTGGRRLRVLSLGDGAGDPVVFVHGFGADLNGWMFNQPVIAERRPTHALDLPGHGGSVKSVGDGRAATLADAVAAALDALGIDRAHLVGHSLGGAVAIALALARPERVASLGLIAPAGLASGINGDFIAGFIAAKRRKQLRPVLDMLVADPGLVGREMIEEVLRFKRLDGVADALRAIAEANFADGRQSLALAPRLGEIAAPILIVQGTEDRIIPAIRAEDLPAMVTLHRLAGAGHVPHLEKAAEVNALLDSFLAA